MVGARHIVHVSGIRVNPLNAELNPIRHLLALVEARHIVHVSGIRVNPFNADLNPIRHLLALVGARHIVHVSGIRVNIPSANRFVSLFGYRLMYPTHWGYLREVYACQSEDRAVCEATGLRAGRTGILIPAGVRFFQNRPNGTWAHPPSCSVNVGILSPES